MSAKKFKFVSPGIFLNEVDQSVLPRLPQAVGPAIVGRTKRGPAFRPTRIDSFSDYLEVFGEPVSGGGSDGDQFRDGVPQGPTYASYAAQAYLRNNGPVTVVRTLGSEHPNKASGGEAGYKMGTTGGSACDNMDKGGAFGLFVFPSASVSTNVTGTLGAIFYLNNGSIELSGTIRGASEGVEGLSALHANASGTNVAIKADSNQNFQAIVKSSTQLAGQGNAFTFNFNPNDDKYIRKVFNTNPTLTNSDVTTTNSQEGYFLGQSFDRKVQDVIDKGEGGSQSGRLFGLVLPLKTSSLSAANYQMAARTAQSGWVISQDLRNTAGNKTNSSANAQTVDYEGADVTRLFKFHSLSEGEWEQRNLKISIERIKASGDNFNKYGSFSIVLRKLDDNDKAIKVVERYDNLNLNPNSPDYIATRVGDMFEVWDDDRRRLQNYGTYVNNSKFIRVEVAHDVETGQANPELVPFGFFGPVIYNSFQLATHDSFGNHADMATHNGATISGSSVVEGGAENCANAAHTFTGSIILVSPLSGSGLTTGGSGADGASDNATQLALKCKIDFPSHKLIENSAEFGLSDHRLVYFGIDTTKSGSAQLAYDPSNVDLAYPLASGFGGFAPAGTTTTSYVFSLDDVSGSSNATNAAKSIYDRFYYVSGSRALGNSITAASGTYRALLSAFEDVGGARFTMPLFGGFDGFDITEKEPFNQKRALPSAAAEQSSYAYYSVKKGMDILADPEFVEMNLAAAPGIVNPNLTSHLINICEERGDALAIIDPEGGYTPNTEDTDSEQTRTSVTAAKDVADNMKARNLNSSYGAAYFPWVQIRDSIRGNLVFVPPSIVGLGVLGASEAKSAVWFAPAGFNRGGLTEGGAGVNVVGVRHKLTSEERDRLYENSINPIASFPAEGIVVFGQKTLQVTPSALDRINVRRLLIFVKKGMSRISATTLFQQNISDTWSDFKARSESFLGGVKAGLGLEAYKVVLDSSTTTPDLVDRNIMYAKIFIKPAKAIEFIALDFVVTSAGASFED
jgi:hypothetical protein